MEIDSLKVFAKPFNDADELLIYCSRCESLNQIFPIHNSHNNSEMNNMNICQVCGQPFIMSLASFEVLPVVEFNLSPDLEGLNINDIKSIIGSRTYVLDNSNPNANNYSKQSSSETTILNNVNGNMSDLTINSKLTNSDSADRLTLTNMSELQTVDSKDSVNTLMNDQDRADHGTENLKQNGSGPGPGPGTSNDIFIEILSQNICSIENYQPIVLSKDQLSLIKQNEILISNCQGVSGYRFFKNLVPEIPLAVFDNCAYGGLASKFDIEVLNIKTNRRCPFF